MKIDVLKNSKDELEIQFENLTLAELLRVYLNKDPSVTFSAWKREHPSERPILNVKTKGKSPKKAINDAVHLIIKELDRIESEFGKIK